MRSGTLLGATLIIGLGYVLSNLTGFAQRMVVTARFGAGAEYDALNVALRIPDLLFNVFAGGALASAFIPVFTEYLSTGRSAHAWSMARATAGLVFAVLSLGSAAAWVAAPLIVEAMTEPPFSAAQVALAADLMRIMLLSPVIFGVSGLLMGVLQSNGRFVAPAFAPALYNLGIMVGAVLLAPLGIRGVAAGVVLGAVLHLFVQAPSLASAWRARGAARLDPTPGLAEDVSHVARLMVPRMIGLGATQLNFIVNTVIATSLGEGAVTSLTLAFVILVLPIAAIAQSVGTALFPALSAHAARDERVAFSGAVTRALGAVIALSAPAMVGLIALGHPIVRALFERGSFTPRASADVAFALACYAVGLIGHATLEITTRGFYALKDTRRPVAVAVGAVALNIALSLVLTPAFIALGLPGFGGPALANAAATLIEAGVMYAWLRRRAGMDGARRLAVALAKSLAAAAGMGGVLWAVLQAFGGDPWLSLLGIPLGAGAYVAFALGLGSAEARDALRMLARRR